MKISLKVKAVSVVLVFVAVLSVASVFISYMSYTKSFEKHYKELAGSISKSTASVVDRDAVKTVLNEVKKAYSDFCKKTGTAPDYETFSEADLEEYYSGFEYITEMPEYKSILAVLSQLREDNGVKSLYLGYNDIDTLKDFYLVDASEEGQACTPGDCDDTEPEQIEKIKNGIYEMPAYITNYPEYGWLCSASAPVYDEDGSVICVALVDISMNEIVKERQAFLITVTIIIAFLSVIMILALLVLVNKALLSPLNRLSDAAGLFVTGKKENTEDFKSEISKLNIKTGDEIENLSDAIKQMENDINTYIGELTTITAEKERIGAELDVAKNIQSSMLPCIFPAFPNRHEFDVFASMTPAKEVGGDFYDFFLVDENHLAIVMADVSGKGVPAALFMVIAKTLLKNSAQNKLSPKAVFEKVNNQLCENNEAGMFVTAWLGILEISTGKMICANAGHEYPVIKRKDGAFELFKDKHGFVLAGMEDAKYREYEIELFPGDRLFVYTDGVPEATNSQNELFGTDRLLNSLNSDTFAGCEELIRVVYGSIASFVGEASQFDDITMLALEISENNKLLVHPDKASISKVASFVEDFVVNSGASVKTVNQINIAVDEIYSNIVFYSGAQTACVECEATDDKIKVIFSDDGKEYNPLNAPEPNTTLGAEERKIGGLGIYMVKKSMDEVFYEYKDNTNIFTIEKSFAKEVK